MQETKEDRARRYVSKGHCICPVLKISGFSYIERLLFEQLFRPRGKGRREYWFGGYLDQLSHVEERLLLLELYLGYLKVFKP